MILRFRSKFLVLCLAVVLPLSAVAGEALWIDVRSATEYSEVHVEQAVNIPHNEIAQGIAALDANKDALIYVYCRSGNRSGLAKDTLDSMGYTQVVNVGGLEDALKKSRQEAVH
jgi:phage shock protein E